VKKSGAWFTYEGEQLGQGREKAKEFLVDNPELMVEITDRVMRKAGIGKEMAGGELEPEVADVES
jgi:recombination protein RecA